MNNCSFRSCFSKFVLPVLIVLAVLCGTVLIPGSTLYQIEDVYVNRILAGTYGEPDWRVLEMNPALSQPLAFLYRILPAVNWYGALLLFLLGASLAMLISRAARQKWGLVPVAMVSVPLLILLGNAVHSQSVCALCVTVGMMTLVDSIKDRKIASAILGGLLLLLGLLLSLPLAAVLAICTLLCMLPGCLREKRPRALLISLPIILVMFLAPAGYSALSYSSPELSHYRESAALYDRLQHSSLRAQADHILDEYATMSSFYQATSEDPLADITAWAEEKNVWFAENLGWSINDISIFTERKGVDLTLVDPEALSSVEDQVSYLCTDPSVLLASLLETVQKPQFILLIAIFLLCALAVVLSNHRKVLLAVVSALVAFGGHIAMLALYRDSFGFISPFYLLSIAVLLYSFSGEDGKAWTMRRLPFKALRCVLAVLCCVVFVCGVTGIVYYQAVTPANNIYIAEAIDEIHSFTQAHPELLFVGDNPCERVKPDTLSVPVRGQDANILAGSYDLYSPRSIEQMERFGVTNPLPACRNSDTVCYISMSFHSTMSTRLAEAYGDARIVFDPLWTKDTTSSLVMKLLTFESEEAYEHFIEENNLVVETVESSELSHEGHDHDHDHDHE